MDKTILTELPLLYVYLSPLTKPVFGHKKDACVDMHSLTRARAGR